MITLALLLAMPPAAADKPNEGLPMSVLDACLKDPGITHEDYDGTLARVDGNVDLNQAVERQVAAYETGKQKFVRARTVCEDEHHAVG